MYNKEINAFNFLKLVKQGKKSFQNEQNFNEFLSLDLNIRDTSLDSPTMEIICSNKRHYHLSSQQIMKICEKSDINLMNKYCWTYLHFLLHINRDEGFNIKNQQLYQLLQKTDLSIMPEPKFSYLSHILENNEKENLGFNKNQLCELYDHTIQSLDNKQMKNQKKQFLKYIKTTFPEFISIYEKNKLVSDQIKNKNFLKLKL